VHVSTGPAPQSFGGVGQDYLDNAKGQRLFTEGFLVDSLKRHHPNHHLSITPTSNADLLGFAQVTDEITCLPHGNPEDSIKERIFRAPIRRYNDEEGGTFVDVIHFGCYDYVFKGHQFLLYVAKGNDGPFASISYSYILAEDLTKSAAQVKVDDLIKTATKWGLELHNEVLVFDQGWWQPNADLWQNVQKSNWEDVILEQDKKEAIIEDVIGFFDAEERYAEFGVPWKRGVIFYGPPGNGKTISTKSLMHDVSKRTSPAIESLYVKTFNSYSGPEYGIRQIFLKARQMAPCLLIFEDIDSLVNVSVRSYFLNEVDGLESNHGILMIGSTNHLERLDPGIAKRPSRFDRKYFFDVPNHDERVQYAEYWRNKLKNNKKVDFPKEMDKRIADITDKFSFAYMKEAFVAALLVIVAHKPDTKAVEKTRDPLSDNLLWNELKRQIENLRKEMEDEDENAAATPAPLDNGSAYEPARVQAMRMPMRGPADRLSYRGRERAARFHGGLQDPVPPSLSGRVQGGVPRYM